VGEQYVPLARLRTWRGFVRNTSHEREQVKSNSVRESPDMRRHREAHEKAFATAQLANAKIQALPDDAGPLERSVLADEFEIAMAEVDRQIAYHRDAEEMAGARQRTARIIGGFEGEHRAGTWLQQELRSIVGGSGAGASFTPSEFTAYFFDLLEAQSIGLRSGFNVVRTERDSLVVPHVLADPSAAWVAEAGTITPSDPNYESLTATPRKLAALTQLSNEIIGDSNPKILDVAGTQMIRSLALKLDLGFFEGSGTAPEIRGLRNVVGIQTVSMGTNGAAPTNLDPFADALGLLETFNSTGSAVVMHPRTWQQLIKLKEQTTGNNKPLLQESAGSGAQGIQRSIYGLPVFLSSQVSITETQGTSTNASSAYVYEASEIVAVVRDETRVELDSSRLFDKDMSEVRAVMRADLVVPNPKAVVRILGLIP
jgi:HK97 family phage major capsid protein